MKLNRRTVLRGAGAALALPYLEAMMPLTALAQSPKAYPVRMAFLFVPNGINMKHWTPTTEGTDYVMPSTLEPLKPFRDSLLVMSGLTQHQAHALGDGGGDHARSAAAWLTGCHPRKTSGADIKAGISADQIAAQKIGRTTRFPSIELGIERGGLAGNCDSGYSCAYSNSISWRAEATPVAKETNPRMVFERLFGVEADDEGESREVRTKLRRSILDFVKDDAASLQRNLGSHDRQKLDEYFTSIREIEHRISFAETVGTADATGLAATIKAPEGVPVEYSDHVRLMGDMMVLAFQTDLTRVATFMFANEGSNRAYGQIQITEGHHELSHHGKAEEKLEKIRQINRFHVEQFAYVLNRLKSVKEGNGTLLDHSMIVYGGGISDGDRHNHDDLPLLLAGKGNNTIRTGRHVRYQNGTPMTNLLLSMLDRAGVREVEKLGDSTGKLQQLI